MGTSDLEMRAMAMLSSMTTIDADGNLSRSPDLEPLQKEIAATIAQGSASSVLQELASTLEMMQQSLSDPDVRRSMSEAVRASHLPSPAIFDAIDDADATAVRKELVSWDVNRAVGAYESTALYHAMSNTCGMSLEIVEILLDAGADPNLGLVDTNVLHGLGFGNQQGISPTALARVIKRCVALGADIEQRSNKLRWTPLITAVSEWNPVAAEALILAGADVNACAGELSGVCLAGADCLSFAAGHDATEAVIKRYRRGI